MKEHMGDKPSFEKVAYQARGPVTNTGIPHPFPGRQEEEPQPTPAHKDHRTLKRGLAYGGGAIILLGGGITAGHYAYDAAQHSVLTEPASPTSKNPIEFTIPPLSTTQETTQGTTQGTTSTTAATTAETAPTTKAPTPTPEVTEPTKSAEELAMQEKFKNAPEIAGLTKVIKERNGLNRVIYERNGVYVGEFKQEVTFEGKETFNGDKKIGMVMLTAVEAQKISSEGDFYLPCDGSDLKTPSNVNLEINGGPFTSKPNKIKISFDNKEEVDLVNVIPDNNTFMMAITPAFPSFSYIYTETNKKSKEIISGQENKFIEMIGESSASDPFVGSGKSFAMGESFFKTSKPIYINLVAIYGTISPTPSLDNIKRINGNPISITNNS